MTHLPVLISDLGLILAAAAITTIIFKKIKQPLVLGYIIAGLLVGPHVDYLPTVSDKSNITIWAEIGVIFLLFSLGLEFSFKKLAKVGGSSSIIALVQISGMSLIGYFLGRALQWSQMDSIFLGAILSVSSTTIIIRTFDELGVKHKKFATLVFGELIVEDLAAILMMVMLTTIAVSQKFAGVEMAVSIVKLAFFLILWFLGGIFIIPSFLKLIKKQITEEMLLVVSLALCLMMVVLAVKIGFSAALGAFIMGSILAETTLAETIERLTKSVKDLFGAVFFVSVGMMIDPAILLQYWQPVVLITLALILGKFLMAGSGALLSGQPLKTSVQTGTSLTMIGEFSFIIASLGLSLNVTSNFLYPITIAVSAISTFVAPYLIKHSEWIYQQIAKILPQTWSNSLDHYSSSTDGITTMSDWRILLRSYIINMVIHTVLVIAVLTFTGRYLQPLIQQNFTNQNLATLLGVLISLLLMSPFLWALSIKRIQKTAYSHLWLNKKYRRGPLIALEIFRVILGVFFVGFLMYKFFDTWLATIIAIGIALLALVIFSQRLQKFYERLESRFFINFNAREAAKKAKVNLPWDSHLLELTVSPQSSVVGQSLVELAVREKYGINIAMIERGNRVIATPNRDERLYPNDKVLVIGTDDQLANVKPLFEEADNNKAYTDTFPKQDMSLQKVVINSKSPVYGQSIRESGIRENTQGLVVGVERKGQRILNPDSDLVFENEDIVWIVGNQKRINELLR